MNPISIVPNGYRINDDLTQVTFFTLTYKGVTYKYHGNTPILTGQELQDWLTANAETIMCDIYRKTYMDAQLARFASQDMTLIEEWEAWIAAGCKTHPPHTLQDGTLWL